MSDQPEVDWVDEAELDVDEADGYHPPPEAYEPSAQNVRRYPELFESDVIDSFNAPDPTSEAVDELDQLDELDETTVEETTVETFTGESTGAGEGTDATTKVTF